MASTTALSKDLMTLTFTLAMPNCNILTQMIQTTLKDFHLPSATIVLCLAYASRDKISYDMHTQMDAHAAKTSPMATI